MNPIIIDLPLPSNSEHQNARVHWSVKAAAVKATREYSMHVARQVRPREPLKKAAYRLIFRLPRKRDYDGLSAWVKAQIDGFVDAGLLANDNDFRPMGIERFSGKKETGGKYGVRFVIWDESHDSQT